MFCSRCGTEVQQGGKFCPSCGLDLTTVTTGGSTPMTEQQPPEQTEFDIVRTALKGEYELTKELGRGGMAIVYRAREKGLDREVAVKVLPFSLSFDKDFVERFEREARTAAKLEHPHIIPIYRVGRNDKVIYFVMKFLRGKSLSDVIKQRGALPPAEARRILGETAHALHYAHKGGIVHRDIKPDNIMLDELDRAIVTDFGIAKAASGTKLTGTGMSIGTPHYMSPEQARAQPLDGRSDIYSLGVVAYQCLTGVVPFDGDDSYSIGFKHVTEDLPTPKLETREQRDLFEIVRRMMAKTPADRFQDAEELARVLEGKAPIPSAPLASAPTVAMRAASTTISPAQAVSASTPTTPMPRTDLRPPVQRIQQQQKKKSGAGAFFAFLLFFGGGGAGGWYYYQNYEMGTLNLKQPPRPETQVATIPPVDSARIADSTRVADSVRTADSLRQLAVTPSPATEKALTGTVVVTGFPRGGRVQVNGKGVDPAAPILVDPGSNRITAQAAGYEDFSTTVTVSRGLEKVIPLAMTKRPLPPGSQPTASRPPAAGAGQCDTPGDTYNVNNLCWDDRAVQLTPPLVPIGDDIPGNPSPSIVQVLVSETGTVLLARGKQISNNPNFHMQALTFAKTLAFQPAKKDGQPVKAWAEVLLKPTRNK